MTKLLSDTEQGCSIATILHTAQESNCTEEVAVKEDVIRIGITEKLISVDVMHENQMITIERTTLKDEFSCPPFCIEPMRIENIVTVGEIETLAFIEKLKEKKSRLLIDVRESIDYDKSTIPGAINLPFSMVKDGSKYQQEILKLLGGKKIKNKWIFKHPQLLLIFGKNVISNEASSMIKQLLKFGYPSEKLLFYRAGFESWKALGLTTY